MLWALYGLLHSLLRAASTETNRAYRANIWSLAFGQALCGVLLLLPLWKFMSWPDDPHFYRAAVGVGLIYSVGMLTQLILSTQKAGRVLSIYMPLEALASTLLWIAVTPAMLVSYRDDPLIAVFVVTAYIIFTIAIFKIRPQDVNWKTFLLVAPLGVTYAIAGVVTKTVMPFFPILPAALSYALISYVVMTAVLAIGALFGRDFSLKKPDATVIKASVLTGLVSVCGYVSFVASVTLAPNPGYTSMLAMLLPVWLLVWHKVIRLEDRASVSAALFIIVAAAMLIIAAW